MPLPLLPSSPLRTPQDVNWTKMRLMMNKYGLVPWYRTTARRNAVAEEAGAAVGAAVVTAGAEPAAEMVPAAVEAAAASATAIEP
jgi:hypothetical protein